MKTALSKGFVLALALLLISAGAIFAMTASAPVSDGGVTPYIIDGANQGGNRTCEEVGLAFFADADYYELTTGKIDYNGSFAGSFAPITVTTDGTYVSWEYDMHDGLAVIVKGSNDANVYVYDGSYTSDSGLASPLNASGGPAGLSNLTFCWNPKPPMCEWIGETAWAAGSRYVTRGNWATYTAYDGSAKSVTLFAGQTMNAGTVDFSDPIEGDVEITITLNPGWRFEEVEENVKIQDYLSAPSGNPAPGQFAHKGDATASPFSITVPANNFYGVHVDVEWEKCD